MQDEVTSTLERCRRYGQEHLLAHWDSLNTAQRLSLLAQVNELDFEQIAKLFHGHDQVIDWKAVAERAEPPNAIRLDDKHPRPSRQAAIEAGRAAIAAGQVAMILVAGGQGTRLGFDLPKGMFRIGPVSNRTLFEMHVDALRGAMRRYQASIPLLIMTGPSTDQPTREYFAENRNLGLADDQLILFQQGTMPAIDAKTGKVLLESKDQIALSPDGHGGIVEALRKHGCIKMARKRGIRYFFYAQVDNPLVTACDPLLVGYHVLSRSQMTTQVVQKRFPKEKVGNVVSVDGRTQIIEYSDLVDPVAEKKTADGSLLLWAGNIAVHVFDVDFLADAASESTGLPFHRAHKAVSTIESDGTQVKPSSPNAIKFERFVFDLLPMAERTFVVEGDAAEVFAPVKNADGATTDTPQATKNALIELHRRWLEAAGVRTISSDIKVEINPLWAIDEEEVVAKAKGPVVLSSDTYFT